MKKPTGNNNTRKFAMLSQLVGLLDRSLASYLLSSRPWARRPYLLLGAVARRLAVEHEHYAGEIARLLHGRGQDLNSHTFPMEFTYYNDLSLEHLAPRLLDHQHRLISFANAVSRELRGDYEVQRILRKLLASLRKYGSLLEELLAPHRFSLPKSGEDSQAAKTARGISLRVEARNARSIESQTAA
jgi:hypothetical protein